MDDDFHHYHRRIHHVNLESVFPERADSLLEMQHAGLISGVVTECPTKEIFALESRGRIDIDDLRRLIIKRNRQRQCASGNYVQRGTRVNFHIKRPGAGKINRILQRR